MPATFIKAERLNSFRDIGDLMRNGKPFFHYPFKVIYKESGPAEETAGEYPFPHRIMISVPKKNFKRAVKRNLLKRRIRESYRLNRHLLASPQNRIDFLLVYISKNILEYKEIESKVADILGEISEAVKKNH